MKNLKVLDVTLCALFAGLSAVLSQISIPIGAVPVNLTHVSIFVAAGLLGAKKGAISQIVFVLLGVIGIPVFSGFTGGIGKIVGPTGGFIIGYIACAFIAGIIINRFGKSIPVLLLAMYSGWIVTYILGSAWYMFVSGTSNVTAVLTVCVLPFLLGDSLKTILSVVLVNRLKDVY